MADLRASDLYNRPIAQFVDVERGFGLLQFELIAVDEHVVFEMVARGLSVAEGKHNVGVVLVGQRFLEAPCPHWIYEADVKILSHFEPVFEHGEKAFFVSRRSSGDDYLAACAFLHVEDLHVSDHARACQGAQDVEFFDVGIFGIENVFLPGSRVAEALLGAIDQAEQIAA